MVEARRRDEWTRTASILTLLFNINRGDNAAKQFADFFPFKDDDDEPKPAPAPAPQLTAAGMARMLVDRLPPLPEHFK